MWEIAGLSACGPERQHNEDAIGFDENLGVLVLADGLGGHAAGEIASSIVVAQVLAYMRGRLASDSCRDMPMLCEWLEEASTMANAKVFARAHEDETCRGMGSTLLAAVLATGKGCIANVSDSRAYALSKDSLTLLTRDHTLLQERIELGLTKEAYAGQIKRRSPLTRAVGLNSAISIDTYAFEMTEGSMLMLASDGLFEPIPDEEMVTIMKEDMPLAAMASNLVKLAIQYGSDDNLSVILARPWREDY